MIVSKTKGLKEGIKERKRGKGVEKERGWNEEEKAVHFVYTAALD